MTINSTSNDDHYPPSGSEYHCNVRNIKHTNTGSPLVQAYPSFVSQAFQKLTHQVDVYAGVSQRAIS